VVQGAAREVLRKTRSMTRPKPAPLGEVLGRAHNKLDQARFHLDHLASAVRQEPTVLLAVESFLGGCLGAVQAAFYILDGEAPQSNTVFRRWKSSLRQVDRKFLERMMKERGDDVHQGRTTLHQNLTIQPGGTPPKSTEFRFRSHSDKAEIVDACQRFIALIEGFAEQFGPKRESSPPRIPATNG